MAEPIEVKIRLNPQQLRAFAGTSDMQEAMTKVGHYVEASAKFHAPVRTGNLRRSIYSYADREGIGWVARVGTNVEYGVFQELGTINHPAHPFLRPALTDLERGIRLGSI